MPTVTLTGKVALPDGQIPSGGLEFTAVQQVEDAAGNIKAPIPASASLDGTGATSVALEAGEQYDVVAVVTDPASRQTSRQSLGRWTAPAAGAVTNPHLFDAWRATLASPKSSLRSKIALPLNVPAVTPKRTSGDVVTTSGTAAGTVGTLISGAATASVPAADKIRAMRLLASGAVAIANYGISGIAGEAFADIAGLNLAPHVGKYLELVDSAGRVRGGFIKAGGGGATYGAELITVAADRDFSVDTGFWNQGPGVTIGAGVAQYAASSNYLSRSGLLQIGGLYVTSYTLSGWAAGYFSSWIGAGSYSSTPYHAANGTYTDRAVADGTAVYYGMVPGGGAVTVAMDDVSLVRQLTPSATGATIASTPGGTESWAEVTSGFNDQDPAGYTYRILEPDSAGTLLAKVLPTTWHGGDGTLHVVADAKHSVRANRILISKTAGNLLRVEVVGTDGLAVGKSLAVDSGNFAQGIAHVIGISWNGGTILGILDAAELTTAVTGGTGRLPVEPTTIQIGSTSGGSTNSLEGEAIAIHTYDAALSVAQMIAEAAAL